MQRTYPAIPSTDPDVPAPLDASVLSAIEDFPVPPDFDKDPNEGKDDKDTPRGKTLSGSLGGVTPSGSGSGDGERKLPKWLKLGPSACPNIQLYVLG